MYCPLTLALLVANLANTKWIKKRKWHKRWHMGSHLRVISGSYPMNTSTTEFKWFSKHLRPCALVESSLNKSPYTCSKIAGERVYSVIHIYCPLKSLRTLSRRPLVIELQADVFDSFDVYPPTLETPGGRTGGGRFYERCDIHAHFHVHSMELLYIFCQFGNFCITYSSL